MSDNLSLLSGHHHVGLLRTRLLQDLKKIPAMEETAACHFRQVFVVRDDVDADILNHTANIYIISDLYNIIHKKSGSLLAA